MTGPDDCRITFPRYSGESFSQRLRTARHYVVGLIDRVFSSSETVRTASKADESSDTGKYLTPPRFDVLGFKKPDPAAMQD